MWKAFYDHKTKAEAGLLALLDPSTPAKEVGELWVKFKVETAGMAEEERNRSLYVDFDTKNRSWTSPASGEPEMVSVLLASTKKTLNQMLSDRAK